MPNLKVKSLLNLKKHDTIVNKNKFKLTMYFLGRVAPALF